MHEELLCILLSAGREFGVTAPYYWLKHLRSDAILFLRNKPSFKSQILPLHSSLRSKLFRLSYCAKVGVRERKTERMGRGRGRGFLLSPSPPSSSISLALAPTFSTNSSRNSRRLTPYLQFVQATDVKYKKARDVAHVILFTLKFHYICRGASFILTWLLQDLKKIWVCGRNSTVWLFKSDYFDSSFLCTVYLLRFYLDKLQDLYQSFIAVAFVSIPIQC